MTDFNYVGSELQLFAAAHNWKSYWSRRIRRFVAGDVLEVGAGIGSNTGFLDPNGNGRWVCLEPDSRLIAQMTKLLEQTTAHRSYEIVCGTLRSLDQNQKFDTIVYIDVLEHIENARQELGAAASHLRPGGRIIVLSPAHQWLFTPFDAAVGHFRRYNRAMFRSISPVGVRIEQLIYLNSVGLVLSIANRLLLRQPMPTKAQAGFWNQCVVPLSRVLDRCLFNSVENSIVGIWR